MSLYTELTDARKTVRYLKAQIKTAKKQKRQIATLKRAAERLARELERERYSPDEKF
jgi:hypothetical protein